MAYATQMDAARQGIVTPQMQVVAEKEHVDAEWLRDLVAKGQVEVNWLGRCKCLPTR